MRLGAALVLMLVVGAVIGPHVLAHDPLASDVDHGLSATGAPLPPSVDAWLGTDTLGRDVWARVIAGSANSLATAALATVLAVMLGLAVGLAAGYAGGRIDQVLMRLVDLVLAFPYLLLAMLFAALLRDTSLAGTNTPVIVTLGAVGWTTIARVIRSKALVVARSDHVTAARALGASPARVVIRHVLPEVAGVAIVMTVLAFAQNLLGEAVLSFVGLGPAPPAPSWGRMIYEGRSYLRAAPWLAIAPGVAIVIAVSAFQLLGEGLRTRLDVKGAPP
jgi:ABC-type dipeptide/oligopeptide/nickel transport system permease subunit